MLNSKQRIERKVQEITAALYELSTIPGELKSTQVDRLEKHLQQKVQHCAHALRNQSHIFKLEDPS